MNFAEKSALAALQKWKDEAERRIAELERQVTLMQTKRKPGRPRKHEA